MVRIINYTSKYDEDVKDLLLELTNYISSLDEDGFNVVGKDCREKYFKHTMKDVRNNEGKIYLAQDGNKIVGLIIGLINNDEIDTYDFCAPKRGRVVEFIVTKDCRAQGIGKKLLNRMEEYFKSVGCKGILIGAFSYNNKAKEFYKKNGFHNRTEDIYKEL